MTEEKHNDVFADPPWERDKRPGIVYLVGSKKHKLYKIGSTTRTLEKRLSEFAPKLPFEIEVFATLKSEDAPREESLLHEIYQSRKFRDDWFVLSENEVKDLIRIGEQRGN